MVHVTRLAHVGLQARSLSTQAEFYNDRWGLERVALDDIDRAYEDLLAREALGFKLTDRFVGGLSFWACNANHHSLAFGQAREGNSHSTRQQSVLVLQGSRGQHR